jgi:hypothetical protein
MAQTAQTSDLPRTRIRSREEMEETYRQIIARDPKEGPALVDTHRRLISLLDTMIAERSRRRRR